MECNVYAHHQIKTVFLYFFQFKIIKINFCLIRFRKMKANLFLQLSHRWVIKGRSFSDRLRFLVFLKLFEQTYISRCLKKQLQQENNKKNKKKTHKKTVLGRRGKFNKPTGVLDCAEHKCQQKN